MKNSPSFLVGLLYILLSSLLATCSDCGNKKANNQQKNDSRSPLHAAISKGDTTQVRLLLEQGAKINKLDQTYGDTPLQVAVASKNLAMVKLLIVVWGASVNAKDKDGNNALDKAKSINQDGKLAEIIAILEQYLKK